MIAIGEHAHLAQHRQTLLGHELPVVHQWLDLDRLDFFEFNRELFPRFDTSTKLAARQEIFATFEHILRENASVRDLLKSDYAILSPVLADYYGIAGVEVVRPNGAVSPCIFWNEAPIGYFPDDGFQELSQGPRLTSILDGLKTGCPVGTCQSCSQRKNALYVRLKRFVRGGEEPSPAVAPAESSAAEASPTSDLVQL